MCIQCLTFLFSEIGPFTELEVPNLGNARWLRAPSSSCILPQTLDCRCGWPCPAFNVGGEVQNSGPYVCTASIITTIIPPPTELKR